MASLGVNIDHVANVRQARRTVEPDPVSYALLAELGGADGITVHLREDRRHIQDRDVELLRATVRSRLNLEMAATAEMEAIALRLRPDMVTLVPERREEVTTEGGLAVAGQLGTLGGWWSVCRRPASVLACSSMPNQPSWTPAAPPARAGWSSTPAATRKPPGPSRGRS